VPAFFRCVGDANLSACACLVRASLVPTCEGFNGMLGLHSCVFVSFIRLCMLGLFCCAYALCVHLHVVLLSGGLNAHKRWVHAAATSTKILSA
jgi:hypothetical protein